MKLLILDLDETLVHAAEHPLQHAPDFRVGPYSVYKRPGLDAFLCRMGQVFDLAVWTSSTRPYALPVVENIFPQGIQPGFVWARERCTWKFNPDMHEHEWLKNLDKLKRKGYRLEQVLMVDDTPAKLARHYGNLVRVRPFVGDQCDAELAQLGEYLCTLAAAPNVRAVEKRSWRSHLPPRVQGG